MTTRRSLALLLLCAQVSALGHLALSPHGMGERGEAVDALPACPEPEYGSGIAHRHGLQADAAECEVVALARTPLTVKDLQGGSSSAVAFTVAVARPGSSPLPPLDGLTVAPKGSPPA